MDAGERATEAAQAEMVKRFRKIYRQAQEEIIEKLNEHWERFKVKDAKKQEQLKAGTITKEEYQDWLNGQVFIGKQWNDKVDSAATSLLYANQQANDIIEGKKRAVFGENATFQSYQFIQDTGMDLSFAIYDSATVTRLLRDEPELLPRRTVNGQKDKAWNRKQIANALTQGIIKGESIPAIAKRIARETSSTNMKAMTRYARTAMTGAQNAGRMEMLHEAQGMGIDVKKKWLATLDSRTRDAHADLDGQTEEVDKPFKSELGDIMYPGDFQAHPGNVYNCRCTLIYVYPKYMPENAERRDGITGELIQDMSYEEWKNIRNRKIVNGSDITEIWQRRENKFPFEIEDVINAQGFNGLPTILPEDEFYKAVEESSFIAQRSYSAPDQMQLDMYQNMLYNGHWYVDCTTGGSQYGQGMYCAADYTGKLSDGIKSEMEHYKTLNESKLYSDAKNKYIASLGLKDFDGIEGLTQKEVEIYRKLKSDRSIGAYMLPKKDIATWREMINDGKVELMNMKLDDLIQEWDSHYTGFTNIETFTLHPSTKIIKLDKLRSIKNGTITDAELREMGNDVFEAISRKHGASQIEKDLARGYSSALWSETQRMAYQHAQEIGDDMPISEWRALRNKATEIEREYREEYSRRKSELTEKRSRLAKVYSEFDDEGSLACALGYDAINAEGHGASGSYTVILNRTKLIILGGK